MVGWLAGRMAGWTDGWMDGCRDIPRGAALSVPTSVALQLPFPSAHPWGDPSNLGRGRCCSKAAFPLHLEAVGSKIRPPHPPDPDCFNPAGLAAVPKSVLNPLPSLSSNFADGRDALPSILPVFFPKTPLF